MTLAPPLLTFIVSIVRVCWGGCMSGRSVRNWRGLIDVGLRGGRGVKLGILGR